jgi:alpha-beta hydrolase superfamily lysophospholipase
MTAPAATPLYFGPAGAGLFGWLHRPAAGAGGGVGLVICNPFGFEEVCAHRGLQHLAAATAAAGIPTLRFDYAGCGNSQDDDFGPEAWDRWIRSVHEAADTLKRACGVNRVCLLGVRLGAALATLAALERDDVEGLIAVAPVLRGRAYLRELTLLGGSGASAPDGSLESAGFILARETVESLARLDLRSLTQRPAPQVLLVERDDMPGGAAHWIPELERHGAGVNLASWAGFAGMMLDPQRAAVPQEIIDGVVGWLRTGPAGAAEHPGPQHEVGASSLVRVLPGPEGPTSIRETALYVDAGTTRLFGVLTVADGSARAARPAVLMLNSGSVHQIGPNRLWVRLARRWAARGITVLRIDLSGIGDSAPREGAEENVVYSAHATQDIAAALAFLRAHIGDGECHLVGLCSGAYHALKAAVAGQALASSLMINPLTYFWHDGDELSDVKEYEVFALMSKYRGKLFTREPWAKLAHGKLEVRLIAQVVARRLWNIVAPYLLDVAQLLRLRLEDDLASELFAAARCGIRLQFVFATHAPGFVLLRKQGGYAIRQLVKRRQASIDFVPHADHTFTRMEARERLVATLDRLIQSACTAK